MLLAATPASVDAVSPAEAQTSADGGTLAQQHPVAAPATADEGAEQPQEAAPSPAANAPGEPPAAAPAGTPPPKDIVVTGRLSSPADPVEKLNAV